MRKFFFAIAALFALTAMQPHTPVFVDPSVPAEVGAGDDFFIALSSNPTTGYSWTQSIADGSVAAYEGNVYEPLAQFIASGPSAIGAAGQQIFIYHANRSGSTGITFSYARPFEKGVAPVKAVTFSITVK